MVVDLNEEQIHRIEQNVTKSNFDVYRAAKKEFSELYKLISDDDTSQENKISLKNYYVVRIVSALEKILRQNFIELIDFYNFDYPEKIKVDSTILRRLRSRDDKLTNGQIFASDINFQNLNDAAKAYDETIGNNFEIQKIHRQRNKDYDEIIKSIQSGMEERHKIVHDYQNTDFALEDIVNFRRSFDRVILDWTEYIREKIDEIRKIQSK